MELRHLKYFVVLAEELHFGRAADRLHMSQPPLSQQIRALEEQIGVKLFTRTSRKVELTSSGQAFLPEARATLERAENSIKIAQLAQTGNVGRLAFGFPPSLPFLDIFDDTLQEFRALYPKVFVQMEELVSRDQIAAMLEKRLDIGFLRNPLPDLPERIETHRIHDDNLIALAHKNNPLAKCDQITIGDLKGVPLVLIHPQYNTGLNMQLNSLCEEAGFSPAVAQYVSHTWTPLSLVSAQIGVGVVYSSLVKKIEIENIKKISIFSQSSRNAIHVAFFKDCSPTARRFSEILLEKAELLKC